MEALTRYFANWQKIESIRYFGMTRSEISEVFQRRLVETELRSILQLLSSLEAAVRVDYLSRCKQQPDDPLSRDFKALHRKRGERPRLSDILELWVDHHSELKELVGQFRSATHLRDWLAHGRYWRPDNWIRYSYVEIEALATEFFRGFPLID